MIHQKMKIQLKLKHNEHYGEKIHETEESISKETSQVLTVFNKAIHHEDDSSDDKSVIEIEATTREWGARNWKTGQTPYYHIPN